MHVDPTNVSKWKTAVEFSQQSGMGHTFGKMGWGVRPPKMDEVTVAHVKMSRQPAKHLTKKVVGVSSKKARELDPMVLEAPGRGEGIQVDIRGGSKTGGGLDQLQGKARQGKGRRGNHLGMSKDNRGYGRTRPPS